MVARVSDVTSELVATGEATMSQIASLFETDAKTLPQRLKGIIPKGKRNGYKVYNIRECAGRLVKPGYEIEEFIRQMSPQELPPLLLKEYWNGQKARLSFETALGNLWPTEDVVEAVAVLSQGIRQSLILSLDDIERDEGFTDGQRKSFRRIIDTTISSMQDQLTEKFKDFYANRGTTRASTAKRLVDSSSHDERLSEAEDDQEVDI